MGRLSLVAAPPWNRSESWHSEWVDVGVGLICRRQRDWEWIPDGADDDIPFGARGSIDWSDEGREFRIRRIEIEQIEAGPELTPGRYHGVPLARMRADLGPLLVEHWIHPDVPQWPDGALPRGRLDDDSYRKIAAVLRRHEVVANKNTTAAVARHFGNVSISTAANWRRTIRERGLDQPVRIAEIGEDGWPVWSTD